MLNTDIPEAQLTAFERWELPSFNDHPKPTSVPESAPDLIDPIASAALAEAEAEAEQQAMIQAAHEQGYAAGQQAGYTAGMQQAQLEINQLQTLMQNLQIALVQVDEQLAQSLLDLALEIAHKMCSEALQIKPEIMLTVVSAAINGLPHFNQNAHLIMHPTDVDLVRNQMGEELTHAGWKIFPDSNIEPGGCRVETAHSHIDATNPARWQSIVDSIGQNKSWLTI
ncbi:MAG: flagellar assembly protein FliH [Gallionella sp.]